MSPLLIVAVLAPFAALCALILILSERAERRHQSRIPVVAEVDYGSPRPLRTHQYVSPPERRKKR